MRQRPTQMGMLVHRSIARPPPTLDTSSSQGKLRCSTGECRAIVEVLRYASRIQFSKLLILSDSLSSLQALLSNPFKTACSSLSLQIKQFTLDLERSGSDVVLAWIPGHSGIIGNEIVDAKARFAAVSGDPCYSQNFVEDLPLARARVTSDWQKIWERSSQITGARYFQVQPSIPPKPWFSKTVFTRRETSVVSRMRLGHCCSPVHLARLHIRDSSICECGLGEGDLNHLIFACPLNNKFPLFVSKLLTHQIQLPINISTLLAIANKAILRSIIQFIKKNDIQI